VKQTITHAEQAIIEELVSRARKIGEIRVAGLTYQIVGQICGLDHENLRKAQRGGGKATPGHFGLLCRAWRCTWQDLLGDWAGRCALASLATQRCDGLDWFSKSRDAAVKAVQARRYPRMEGRSLDSYQELHLMGEQASYFGCLVAVAPVIAEAIEHPWKAPSR
jgi:hypothetical protein